MTREVTLYNQHAMCGIKGTGRTYLEAMRNACEKAGNEFLLFPNKHVEDMHIFEWWALFFNARSEVVRFKYYSCTADNRMGMLVQIKRGH